MRGLWGRTAVIRRLPCVKMMTLSRCNGLPQVLVDACAESGITPIEFHCLWLWTQDPVAHTFVSSRVVIPRCSGSVRNLRRPSCRYSLSCRWACKRYSIAVLVCRGLSSVLRTALIAVLL